jgi:hypothetical protein
VRECVVVEVEVEGIEMGMGADGGGSDLDGEGERELVLELGLLLGGSKGWEWELEETDARDCLEPLALSKEDSVRERDNIRFATPLPLPAPPILLLDGLGENSKSLERSLAGFLGVNGSIESIEEEDGRVG